MVGIFGILGVLFGVLDVIFFVRLVLIAICGWRLLLAWHFLLGAVFAVHAKRVPVVIIQGVVALGLPRCGSWSWSRSNLLLLVIDGMVLPVLGAVNDILRSG